MWKIDEYPDYPSGTVLKTSRSYPSSGTRPSESIYSSGSFIYDSLFAMTLDNTNQKILVIDDRSETLQLFTDILSEEKYQIRTALTGHGGLEIAEAWHPDLIILDMIMPGMDGSDVLSSLKQKPSLADIPIIIISAHDNADALIRGFQGGAVDFISKPFFIDEVRIRIRTRLELAENRHHLESAYQRLKESEQARMIGEERLKTILRALPQIVVYITLDDMILFANRAFKQNQFGLFKNLVDPVNRSIQDVFGVSFSGFLSLDKTMLLAGESLRKYIRTTDTPEIRPDIHMDIQQVPFTDESGTVIGYFLILTDISPYVHIEQNLIESERKYRSIIENIQDVFLRTDEDGVIQMASPSAYTLLKIPLSHQILGKKFSEFYPSEKFEDIARKSNETDLMRDYELQIRADTGDLIWVLISMLPLNCPNCKGYDIIIHDISERKAREKIQEENSEHLQRLINGGPTLIGYVDPDLRYIYVNQQYGALFGYNPEEIIGKHVFEIIPDEVFKVAHPHYLEALDGNPVNFENTVTLPGKEVILSIVFIPDFSSEGHVRGIIGFFQDITRDRKYEQDLRESEKKYRMMTENISDVIWQMDPNLTYTYISPVDECIRGFRSDEVIGKNLLDFVPPEFFDYLQKMVAERRAIMKQGNRLQKMVYELKLLKKDGSSFWTEIVSDPVYDENQRLMGFMGVVRDIDRRKNAEIASTVSNKKLRILTSITRHDILNKLTVVMNILQILEEDMDDSSQLALIRKGLDATDLIHELIDFTTDYENLGVKKPQWFEVGSLFIKSVISFRSSPISFHSAVSGIFVYADSLLEKVFYNMADNTLRHGGAVTEVHLTGYAGKDGYHLVYSDNGSGISDSDRPNLFQKGYGKNTGMGLFLIREILQITGIAIEENGTEGQGVRFEMIIPDGGYGYNNPEQAEYD